MDFKTYQNKASETIAFDKSEIVVPFLGLIGELGSIISVIKNFIRDPKNKSNYNLKLKEELGDVLWYVSAIANLNDLNLTEIASENLIKTKNRFSTELIEHNLLFDNDLDVEEKLPREIEINFICEKLDNKEIVKVIDMNTGGQIGNSINDNSYKNDGYRFHDIFHFGYLAHLTTGQSIHFVHN